MEQNTDVTPEVWIAAPTLVVCGSIGFNPQRPMALDDLAADRVDDEVDDAHLPDADLRPHANHGWSWT